MRRPVDSLFGRLALLFIGVLLISHVAWFALMRLERNQMQTRYAVEEATFLVDAVRQHVAREPGTPLPSRVKLVDPASAEVPAVSDTMPEPLRRFIDDVRDRMPPGTDVRAGPPGRPPTLWVRGPQDAFWIVVPGQPLRIMRPLDKLVPWFVIIFAAAVIAALVAAWMLQQPLRALAQGVGRFGRGEPVPPVPERGPRELRQLTRGFNQMVKEVERTEKDRAVMLAGVAHDLKTPLARLRLRAEMMDEQKVRDGVVRDVESMAHIVDQFLVFAHDGADRSEPVEVDDQCERIVRNYRTVGGASIAIETRLRAGPEFRLPAATLERVVSNLLDNAHAYGAPPVVIESERGADGFSLTVRDHGTGIPDQDLTQASRPFVRLDPARGGNGHSGLGLAIVERLVRRAGGELAIGNGESGGLAVRMTFAFDVVARTVSEAAQVW
ncbi:Signal transduction histidine kinase [Paraburkholderia unamae]|uniref:ATP-binding protein n=1 Tax=Paraburkholderia unamae TaxID=219649 RepID=UPI000DC2955D|nr:ATP-binding protein [Paraburkholderia unamae]RAR60742.1 two-component system osmolarity sensor histidine kinase EnvZ [Paraburkholderia unamae]CAG9273793.1 Signal transduction histidine kinase [Paraburkholderia unamae]